MDGFEEGYFQGEWREGFYVESKMKCAWAAEMEVLKEIGRICKKHNIMWFADCGTLLGAARHKGFIPWDDDIDICMKREDYQRFLQIVRQELPEGWLLLSIFDGMKEGWDRNFSRVVNGDSIRFDDEYLKRFHGCPYMVGVDIFVLDEVPDDPDEREMFYLMLKYIAMAIAMIEKIGVEASEKYLVELEQICNTRIDRQGDVLNKVRQLSDMMCRAYQGSGAKELMRSLRDIKGDAFRLFKKEWYRESILLPFENMQIPVPVEYGKVLDVLYGKKCMSEIRRQAGHDYPFYKKWDILIENMKGEKNQGDDNCLYM